MHDLDESIQCQWREGQSCMVRPDGKGDACLAVIKQVDIQSRLLDVVCVNGFEGWVFMEFCYREGK